MITRVPPPRLDRIPDAHERKRVMTTISSTDADDIPKVDGAGELVEVDGRTVQRMHNGLLLDEGGYGGPWMTEIIRSLHGHHEPQEERVFHALVERLKSEGVAGRMVEFGSYWSYYSLWFANALPNSQVIGLEPDPNNMEVGRRNAALNSAGERVTFIAGAVGDTPGARMTFVNESDGASSDVEIFDLDTLMAMKSWDRVDLILADIQGAETALLETTELDFLAGKVRFLVVSTHHNSISGDPLTHQKALAYFERIGAHIIAEHSVPESFSGDGLIAVSFDELDADLVIPVSYARARDSIFDELEWELQRAKEREQALAGRLEDETARADDAEAIVKRVRSSWIWRGSQPLRKLYRRLRPHRRRPEWAENSGPSGLG
jgi:FkbM family methyltransferase